MALYVLILLQVIVLMKKSFIIFVDISVYMLWFLKKIVLVCNKLESDFILTIVVQL
jgi:hypothetical protein